MQGKQGAVAETLGRVQQFLDDNTALLAAVNQSDARKRLDDTVTTIGSHAVAQVGGGRTSQGETARQGQLRLTLRNDHMRPIAVIASQKLREVPEFTKLGLPPFKTQGPALAAKALDMADAAEKYTDLFVKEGLAPDFVAQLRSAVDALDQSMRTRGQSQGQRAGATTGLQAQTSVARAVIRQLDALVRPKLGTNQELLREWEFASHIKRPRTPHSAPAAAGTSAAGTSASGTSAAATSPTAPSGSTPAAVTPSVTPTPAAAT